MQSITFQQVRLTLCTNAGLKSDFQSIMLSCMFNGVWCLTGIVDHPMDLPALIPQCRIIQASWRDWQTHLMQNLYRDRLLLKAAE